jgi:hypothetical protein
VPGGHGHADTDATHVSGALRACTGTAACIRQHAAWRASDNMQRASDYIRQPCIRQHAAPQNVGARSAGLACTHALASRSASKCPVPEVELVRHPAGPSRSPRPGEAQQPRRSGPCGPCRVATWLAPLRRVEGCSCEPCRLPAASRCTLPPRALLSLLRVARRAVHVALRASHVLQVCAPRAE